ncbi:MAG: hypothetical protein ACREQP_24100 [Candidatus Binatia bacterium]
MAARLCIRFAYVLLLVGSADAQDTPTSLTCTSNAKAWRDYGFTEKQWSGAIPPDPTRVFGVSTVKQKQPAFPLRDKVFSALNTSTPVIRSITPPRPGLGQPEDEAAEFKGAVISRTADAVFVLWRNDLGNKVWLAVVDLTRKKVNVSQVFQGVTSVGIEAETLDCK